MQTKLSEIELRQRWERIIAAVHGKKMAQVWFDYKRPLVGEGPVASVSGQREPEAAQSKTERQVMSEPETSSRQPIQSLGPGDTLR